MGYSHSIWLAGNFFLRNYLGFVSSSLQNINRPGVVYRELDVETPELELVAAWKSKKTSPVLEKFLQIVRKNLIDRQ
ncbi:MAG: hypothetical protein QNJ34_19755 [Xenococcaceae cyanobacterium MO_188.B29]|nr:hypothetical protein [Xenococcaceae cyanobacterium MO_188.B29]